MDLYRTLTEKLEPGIVLHTPTNISFTLERIQTNSLIIGVGDKGQLIKLPREVFEEVVEYLSKAEWVPIGAIHDTPKQGTVDEIVRRYVRSSAASYVVPILAKAGIVEIDARRPSQTRLIR